MVQYGNYQMTVKLNHTLKSFTIYKEICTEIKSDKLIKIKTKINYDRILGNIDVTNDWDRSKAFSHMSQYV